MSPAEWGLIRDEKKRTELKNEAAAKVLIRRRAEAEQGLHARVGRLESAITHGGSSAEVHMRALEVRLDRLEKAQVPYPRKEKE